MTKYPRIRLLSTLLWLGWLGVSTPVAQAQVSADRILSTTITSTDNLNFWIDGGDRAGANLFHSFDEFPCPLVALPCLTMALRSKLSSAV